MSDAAAFERVRELFDYDPLTGVLTWRVLAGRRIHIGDIAGSKKSDGYLIIQIDGRRYFAHRVIWLWMTGAWPTHQIDHINVNKADNRWLNLREATRSQNMGNRPAQKNNKNGLKGVCQRPSRKWRSQIKVNGKNNHLGTYDTPEEAHAAYIEAAERYFGEYARAA